MARLMSIRPTNGARRFASSKDRSILERSKSADNDIRPAAATAVTGADTAVSIGSDRDGLSGALTAPLALSMINKALGFFKDAHYAGPRGQPPSSLRLAAAPLPVWLRSRSAKHSSSWVGGNGERL